MVRSVFALAMLMAGAIDIHAQEKVKASSFKSPLKQEWKPSTVFGTEIKGKGKLLGEEMEATAEAPVLASAKGRLVYPRTEDADDTVILAHWISDTTAVFTVYRPLKLAQGLKYGSTVEQGEELGRLVKASEGKTRLLFQINIDPRDKFRNDVKMEAYASGTAPNTPADYVEPSVVLALRPEKQIEYLLKEEKNPDRKK